MMYIMVYNTSSIIAVSNNVAIMYWQACLFFFFFFFLHFVSIKFPKFCYNINLRSAYLLLNDKEFMYNIEVYIF